MKKAIIFFCILCGLNANAQSSWSLTGNSGTNSSSNFLGTTDNQDLVLKTNNLERIRMYNSGNIDFSIGDQYDYPISSTFRFKGNSFFSIGESSNEFAIYSNPQGSYVFRVNGDNMNTYLQEDKMGKVIIGSKTLGNCNDCDGYKLFVKDGIRTEKVKVDIAATNGWADYVFAKDYKLMPLKELDKFIITNGHLPEVPTTEEAIKNGIELKEMNILLLKKIEELTLYTIEQQKRIETLENKLK